MPPQVQSRFWQKSRVYFRRVRIAVWLLLLLLVGAGVYLNQIGLPGFLQRPLLANLRARGVDLQFSRLRLRWYRGIVAENVRIGRADPQPGPSLSLRAVEVRLDFAALRRLELQVSSLMLVQGQIVWPVALTNQPARELAVSDIQTELRFLPGDQWEVENFQARFAGANLHLTGSLSNASAVREWKFSRSEPGAPPVPLGERLRRLAEMLERVKFSAPPQMRLMVQGDARDFQSFHGRMLLSAESAETPWGALTNGLLMAQVQPAANGRLGLAEINLEAERVQTRWSKTGKLEMSARFVPAEGGDNLIRGNVTLLAGEIESDWGRATEAEFTAHWTQSTTNPLPLAGQGEVLLTDAKTRWGGARGVRWVARFETHGDDAAVRADESWAGWTNLVPFTLAGRCEVTGWQSPKLDAEEIICDVRWRAPELAITNLQARLYRGRLDARAELNVATRELRFEARSDFDAQKIAPLLTEKARQWLGQFSWESPPQVSGMGFLILPPWTNRQPDWRAEVQPTLQLQGEFKADRGAFCGVPVTSARSHVTYSNLTWHLPDLFVTRPEGEAFAEHRANERTKDYYWHVHSTADVRALRPLLETNGQRVLDYLEFTAPPVIDAEIWGRWRERDRTGVKAQVALTNFSFRGQSAADAHTELAYTNRVLQFFRPEVRSGDGRLSADTVDVDFNGRQVFLTNGFSTADPMVVARAIGTKVAASLEPYQFLRAPTVRASGVIPTDSSGAADLHFDLDGGPFHWWKFNAPRVSGSVHWVNQTLGVTNVQADAYAGQADGWAAFNFSSPPGSDFSFEVAFTNVSLHLLMSDLSAKTNRLEGDLNGFLSVSQANSADPQSWWGNGRVRLRDGLIWEIPIFSIFSPILEEIWQGLGKTRFSEGSARFTITNGVIHSDNLEIRAPALRMRYRGTADFQGRVDARVEAELLRDFPLIGRLVSFVLSPITKIFEYKVGGTLSQPLPEPVYIPKLFLLPLHPIRTLKELFSGDSSPTNAPPGKVP